MFLCYRVVFANRRFSLSLTQGIPQDEQMFEIKDVDNRKGRGVIATQEIGKGEVVMSVRADIAVLYSSFAPSHCHDCFSEVPDDGSLLCPRCKQFALCEKCGCRQNWEAHEVPCTWFCSLPPDVQVGDTDYLRFLLEYCARVQSGETGLLVGLASLCTNEDSQSPEVRQFCQSYSKLVSTHFGGRGVMIDQEHMYHLLLQTKSNSIGFPFSEAETLGWAMHRDVCMLNHSCSPTCAVRQSPDGLVEVVATTNVLLGEELSISYLDLDRFSSIKERRRHLLEQYRFLCNCPKCAVCAE